jgi:hypothetical protein
VRGQGHSDGEGGLITSYLLTKHEGVTRTKFPQTLRDLWVSIWSTLREEHTRTGVWAPIKLMGEGEGGRAGQGSGGSLERNRSTDEGQSAFTGAAAGVDF